MAFNTIEWLKKCQENSDRMEIELLIDRVKTRKLWEDSLKNGTPIIWPTFDSETNEQPNHVR